MLFNSIGYGIFLPIVFVLYWFVLSGNVRKQNVLLLISSYAFYAFWDWRFCTLIIISSLTDFLVGKYLALEQRPRQRKMLLLVSIGVNLGILGLFKYYNFFVDSMVTLLGAAGLNLNTTTLNIILPIGISFYTFQTLSYTIDIYRGKLAHTDDWLSFFTFVAFFPQLVAGPIERASRLLPQLTIRRTFSYDQATSGMRLILWGLFKKVVIADNIARYVDFIYADPGNYYNWTIILAVALFSIQIYGDFSGYSDIAIGSARLFGINLMTNFRTPYFSRTFKEFWSRWHISLSTWFRDYVYIPLGGNRRSQGRWIFSILTTFTISGLWHGADSTFIIWGSLFGLYYIIEHFVLRLSPSFKLPPILCSLIVFSVFSAGFYLFRAESMQDSVILLSNTFAQGDFFSPVYAFESLTQAIITLIAIGIFVVIEFIIQKEDVNYFFSRLKWSGRWAVYFTLSIFILILGDFQDPDQFVYFQF
jgi:D-alanyl-lipoteichoic acid acyltransferase DltB (MBOAT superfamily)